MGSRSNVKRIYDDDTQSSMGINESMMRMLPLIEWICVAGLPIFLIIQSMQWRWSGDENNSQSMMSITTCADSSIIFDNDSFQWSLLILVITSILSLVITVLFGDTTNIKDSRLLHNCNNRGAAMGSNLVPLHYMAYIISTSRVDRVKYDNDLCQQQSEQYTSVVGKAMYHLEFSSLSGLAFVISFAWVEWSRYNHRKYNCRRLDVGVNGIVQINGQGVINSVVMDPEQSINSSTSMQNCWKIYTALLLFRSTIISYNINTAMMGSLHNVLIFLYNRRYSSTVTTNDVTWQDAFTPGEYMVVSALITSLVGEFILQYSGMPINNTALLLNNSRMPIHLFVAHAGLVGCLVGVTFSSMMMKKLASLPSFRSNTTRRGKELTASLVAVVGITIGCLEMALNVQQLNEIYCGVESTTCYRIPRCVIWLVYFLSSKSIHIGLISVSRTMVLIYWTVILAICIPITSRLTLWITTSNTSDANEKCSTSLTRKQRVVIARKYFHLVAILLFAPITYLDPDMMSLSYAIAIALLIVIEMVRGCLMVDNDDKIEAAVKSAPSLNDFYLSFMDEKDSSASGGGIAVTHIALIMGCAIPCWVYQLLQQASLLCDDKILALLPFLGLVVLGIGDSVGAISGIKFGRHHWPSSTRTMEGSVCMFLSMVLVILSIANISNIKFTFQAIVTMFVMTLLEASTSQTDNLCLPIAGSTLLLLLGGDISI